MLQAEEMAGTKALWQDHQCGVFWEHKRPGQVIAKSLGECRTKGKWSRQGLRTPWGRICSLA